MSQFETALDWMMQFEDPQRQYAIVPDPGGFAISGINSAAWPEDYADIAEIPQAARVDAVTAFYREHFWNQWLEQIESDEVAKRVFDADVNMGLGTATRLLQGAVNLVIPEATAVDGALGPNTIGAVNRCDAQMLENAFCEKRSEFYEAIVAKNPADAKYLAGWMARANKPLPA